MSSSRDQKPSGSKGKRPSEGEPSDKKSKAIREEPKFPEEINNLIIKFTTWETKHGKRIRTTDWDAVDINSRTGLKGYTKKDLYNQATSLMKKKEKTESGAKSNEKFWWDKVPELDGAVMAAGRARAQRKGTNGPTWEDIIKEFPVLDKAVKDRVVDAAQIRDRYNQQVRAQKK